MEMTMDKGVAGQCKYFSDAEKTRPNTRKTAAKVLLVAPAKRLSFELRQRFP
jgi:hypothetical protein